MKKNEKRYHKVADNKIASVYIQKYYLDKTHKYTDDTEEIDTAYYEYIGVCVGKSRRANNDWWNGDKNGSKVDNKSTGTTSTFMYIIDMIKLHILEFYNINGYYCCSFIPSDSKRCKVYLKAIRHICKKYHLTYRFVICDYYRLEIMVLIE